MHQLPGRRPNRWVRTGLAVVLTAVATVWMIVLLPFLLLATLIIAILMVPVMQRLRKELESIGSEMGNQTINISEVDVTPWHRRARNAWKQRAARSVGTK